MKQHTIIIAEAGVNHNGDLDLARKMIEKAAEAGADYVKFQTFSTEKLVTKNAQKASYQQVNTGDAEESQFNMLKKLELSEADHHALIAHCKACNIRFFSTAFDLESLAFLKRLDLPLFKIPSGEITNKPYLRSIARGGKEVILSTGMATMAEVEDAVNELLDAGLAKDSLFILHCNTEYPTPFEDVHLRAMLTIGQQFGVKYGYSDHTNGISVPIASVALGAAVIEKHFTLDKTMPGPDHAASLEPAELKQMVTAIREVEAALGLPLKQPSPSERKNIAIARKSIHLATALASGTVLTAEHLEMLRPGDGISPMQMDTVIGKVLKRDLTKHHKLQAEDIV